MVTLFTLYTLYTPCLPFKPCNTLLPCLELRVLRFRLITMFPVEQGLAATIPGRVIKGQQRALVS